MADAPPISLVEQVNAIMSLLLAFKQEVDPSDDDRSRANELVKRVQTVAGTLSKLPALAVQLGDAGSRPGALEAIEKLVVADSGVSLAVFFKQVGSAVIKAQRALDAEFERETLSSPPDDQLAPVQYAIPSVHAEMKVGFSQVSSRGVNLLVFNNSQQKQNYSESTISFDIVAAPAPPKQARLSPAVTSPGGRPPDEGVGLESARLAPTPVARGLERFADDLEGGFSLESRPIRAFAHLDQRPTFPLRDDARARALTGLEEALAKKDRRYLEAIRDAMVIVPADTSPERPQTVLYLCPEVSGARAPRTRRAFRCYLADVSASDTVSLRPLRRPDALVVNSMALRGGGLIVPVPPITSRDRAMLPDVLGGAGSALLHLVKSANAFLPACVVNPEDADLMARIRAGLPPGMPKLVKGEPWAVFVDPGQAGPQHAEYIVLRAQYKGSEGSEWGEFHVAGVSRNKRRRPLTPHVHIPEGDTVETWKAKSPGKLAAVAAELEPLLRRLTAIIDAAR